MEKVLHQLLGKIHRSIQEHKNIKKKHESIIAMKIKI
jgi:hypothetical protein